MRAWPPRLQELPRLLAECVTGAGAALLGTSWRLCLLPGLRGPCGRIPAPRGEGPSMHPHPRVCRMGGSPQGAGDSENSRRWGKEDWGLGLPR